MPDRDWSDANEKRLPCRICADERVELAHVIGRARDRKTSEHSRSLWVNPDSVVALCTKHHRAYDAHELDLLPYLTLAEQVQAVRDAGGIEAARRRTCPVWRCPNCGAEHSFGKRLPGVVYRLLCGQAEDPYAEMDHEVRGAVKDIEADRDRLGLGKYLPSFLK